MLTQERAIEVTKQQAQFPFWGNYSKFMTEDEIWHVQHYWNNAKSGNVTFAAIVSCIAKGLPLPELEDGCPPFEQVYGT